MASPNYIEHNQMETIRVRKLNHSTIHLECDRGVATELREFFSFYVPGYRFMPAYRNKVWDGKIRLFSAQTGKIYVGLLSYVQQFCDTNEIQYIIEDNLKDEKLNLQKDTTENFIKSLRPTSNGKLLELRDYQIDAVHSAIRKHRGLFLSPTASGKSLIIYSLVRYYDILLGNKKY